MKLMVCIIQQKYCQPVMQLLGNKGFRATKLASTGGFLKQGNATLLIGIPNEETEHLLQELQLAVDQVEKQKGWRADPSQFRYTSFVIAGQNFLPLLASSNVQLS